MQLNRCADAAGEERVFRVPWEGEMVLADTRDISEIPNSVVLSQFVHTFKL